MNNEERTFIEVENLNGEIDKVEIFGIIKSKREDKTYVLLTPDKEIGEEVNIDVGYIYEENGKPTIELVKSSEEINYVNTLIKEIASEG